MASKNVEVCEMILEYFKKDPEAKVRPLSLSNEIGADAALVETVLNKYRMFFTYLPTEKYYKLNTSSRFKGDIVMMKINAESIIQEKNLFQKYWYLIALSVLVALSYFMLGKI